jgi:hypothetical protein
MVNKIQTPKKCLRTSKTEKMLTKIQRHKKWLTRLATEKSGMTSVGRPCQQKSKLRFSVFVEEINFKLASKEPK